MDRGKILIIDDNEIDLQTTKELLEKVGYKVLVNKGWLGTTKTIRYEKPDLILLDVNMPDLSGDKLINSIREEVMKIGIPVLFYSSFDEEYLRKLLLQCNVNDFITKGDVFQLYKKISKYLKRKGLHN